MESFWETWSIRFCTEAMLNDESSSLRLENTREVFCRHEALRNELNLNGENPQPANSLENRCLCQNFEYTYVRNFAMTSRWVIVMTLYGHLSALSFEDPSKPVHSSLIACVVYPK
jgi:hypothetical protein